MSDVPLQDMLVLARRLAVESGELARQSAGQTAARRKPDRTVVTDADGAIQKHLLAAIEAAYPDHAVIAEEARNGAGTKASPTAARYCWVIDPLDGTRNYVAGFPCFATSIGVLDEGRPVVGVVREHNCGHVYAATHGGGATLNDRALSIRASSTPTPSEQRFRQEGAGGDQLVGIASTKDRLTIELIRVWAGKRDLILRNVGATAVHLGFVASGAFSAAFCAQSKIWDLAAGVLLVNEAGGRVTDAGGREIVPFRLDVDFDANLPFLAAAPHVHAELLRTILSLGA